MKETKIKLYGALAEKYGKEFTFFGVDTVLTAIDALSANFSSFRADVLKNKYYHVWIDDTQIDENELILSVENRTIKIMPTLQAAGGGVGKVILGAVLIAASFLPIPIPGYQGFMVKMGLGLMLAGFAELIFTPPIDTPDADGNSAGSYLFSGAVNIVQEGVPVPLGYGLVRIGSTNISNSIREV